MMKFRRYPKIENTYNQKQIDYLYAQGLNIGAWIVQEKVHGTNLSFWTDGKNTLVAKRSGFLDPQLEKFYSAQEALSAHAKPMIDLFKKIEFYTEMPPELKYSPLVSVAVYGELFGGNYNHPDVPAKNRAAIQKGVMYSPFHHFIGFDIRLEYDNGTERWLDTRLVERLLRAVGIRSSRTLMIGTFEDCFRYQNDFDSLIPSHLGLPFIDGNTCEGVVIKPAETRFYGNGHRVIFKNKNDKFKEMSTKPARSGDKPSISAEATAVYYRMNQYVTYNRFVNVLSHLGEFDVKRFGEYIRLMFEDVVEDALANEENLGYHGLSKQDARAVNKSLNGSISSVIREYMRGNAQ